MQKSSAKYKISLTLPSKTIAIPFKFTQHSIQMKKIFTFFILPFVLTACGDKNPIGNDAIERDTVYIHDTVCPNGTFTYNLPCRVVNIHQENEGKSILFLWLHGGVHDTSQHDFFGFNHMQCSKAPEYIVNYLNNHGIKSIALFPICHKAKQRNCVTWRECYRDVIFIINDYTSKGLVDPNRIYIAGSSDGGTGTWDYIEKDNNIFAAAIAMSCSNPRKTTIPVYFFNTANEPDCNNEVAQLNSQGCKITYKHCTGVGHGGDDIECNDSLLDKFFSFTK